MATKAKEKPPTQRKGEALTLPVAWGNVNIGDETANLGAVVLRSNLSVAQADKSLCGKRLLGTIVARAGDGAQADQGSLPGAEGADEAMTAAFDVKRYGVSRKTISFGLTLSLGSIDIEVLAKFAKRNGLLCVDSIGEIPEEESKDDE